MKRLALIAAVVFTTLTIQSCRESDDVLSPEEALTLQRVQDSSKTVLLNNSNNTNSTSLTTEPGDTTTSNLEGEIAAPPKK